MSLDTSSWSYYQLLKNDEAQRTTSSNKRIFSSFSLISGVRKKQFQHIFLATKKLLFFVSKKQRKVGWRLLETAATLPAVIKILLALKQEKTIKEMTMHRTTPEQLTVLSYRLYTHLEINAVCNQLFSQAKWKLRPFTRNGCKLSDLRHYLM